MYSKDSILAHIETEKEYKKPHHAVPVRDDGGKSVFDGFTVRQMKRPDNTTHKNHPCPQCSSIRLKFHGYTSSRTRRLACKDCGKTFCFVDSKVIKSMRVDSVRQARAKCLFIKGESTRVVAVTVGLSRNTAMKIRRLVVSNDLRCKCGKHSGHKGWCRWRLSRSKARQAVLKSMHKNQRLMP